jgi:hypothetical protein
MPRRIPLRILLSLLPLLAGLLVATPAIAEPRSIHVYVALCDNENQGIVPVPAQLGKGDDPARNLYWGAAFGVKTYFQRSTRWKLVSRVGTPRDGVLERVVFKHRASDTYLIADAYDGRAIRKTVEDFLKATAGLGAESISVEVDQQRVSLRTGGGAALLAYVGHNGLMDFQMQEYPRAAGNAKRQAVILACASKPYFTEALRATGATPLLWTSGLMAPEAYTLHDTLEGWILGESPEQIRYRAAEAYHRFQKCGLRAALRLFQTGW